MNLRNLLPAERKNRSKFIQEARVAWMTLWGILGGAILVLGQVPTSFDV